METIIEKLNIDLFIVAIVFLAGFFQEKYLCHLTLSKDPRYDAALKTLALSLLVSVIYIVLIYDKSVPMPWAKYFISYFAATSLYDMLIRPVTRMIQKWSDKTTGKNEQPKQ